MTTQIEIRNLTSNVIRLVDSEGKIRRTFENEEKFAFVGKEIKPNGELVGIPFEKTEEKLVNLPSYEVGTFLIVNPDVARAAQKQGRDTGDLLIANMHWGEKGIFHGYCRSLSYFE